MKTKKAKTVKITHKGKPERFNPSGKGKPERFNPSGKGSTYVVAEQ